MIGRIDAAVLAWAQGVVDLAQRRPVALARVAFVVALLLELARWLLDPPPLVGVVALLLCYGVMALWCSSEALLASIYSWRVLRLTALFFMALQVLVRVVGDPSFSGGLAILRELALVALAYFAACRPPAPRPPRRVGSLAGGRA